METQVRVYRAQPGDRDAFVREWREHVVPLRRRFGFEVVTAWASLEDDTFVCALAREGGFAEADRAYYSAPERAILDPDPARLIAEPRAFRARPVTLP